MLSFVLNLHRLPRSLSLNPLADYLKLMLMRHGESVGNVDKRLEGQTSTSLSARGQQQAHQLAIYLKQQSLPTVLYSSPLRRAIETAGQIALLTRCSPQIESALQELHQGIFEGLTWAEACHQYPQVCSSLSATFDFLPVPGAESPEQAHQRAVAWYQTLWQRHAPGESIWMVSHGGFMQHLIRVILGCDRSWQIPIGHTALFEFWLVSSDLNQGNQTNPECWKVLKFNETPHLSLKFE